MPTPLPPDDTAAFFDAIPDAALRDDARALDALMRDVTGETPQRWGNILGYGRYQAATGPWLRTGFAARRSGLVLYLMVPAEALASELAALGRPKTGKGCIYLPALSRLDHAALRRLVHRALALPPH